jgi:hypothetical protein
MNCFPPTSRFFIGTLHQVQSRSGRSEEAGSALEGEGVAVDMRGIFPERLSCSQPHASLEDGRIFLCVTLHLKKIMI